MTAFTSSTTKRRRSIAFLAALLTALSISTASIAPAQAVSYTDDTSQYIYGAKTVAERALSYVGKASSICSNGTCAGMCDHVAAYFWGYANSGFTSANSHWSYLVNKGKAKPGSYVIPKGALLFWNTGTYGHVAVYVGGGYVVSSWKDAYGNINLRKVAAASVTSAYGGYRGWGYPIFLGSKL